jgi:hypothetical protein
VPAAVQVPPLAGVVAGMPQLHQSNTHSSHFTTMYTGSYNSTSPLIEHNTTMLCYPGKLVKGTTHSHRHCPKLPATLLLLLRRLLLCLLLPPLAAHIAGAPCACQAPRTPRR